TFCGHARRTLRQPWISRNQLVEGHPESPCVFGLANVGRHVEVSPARPTCRQDAESSSGCYPGATARQSVPIAGALPRARIRGAEQRQPQDRPTEKLFAEVLHPQMAQLVSHVEPQAFSVSLHCIDNVRSQYYVPDAKKLGRESVEYTVAVQNVDLWWSSDI